MGFFSPWARLPTIQVADGLKERVLSLGSLVDKWKFVKRGCLELLPNSGECQVSLLLMSCLVSCLWWTSVVRTAWLTSIFLEALSHISLFHSRSCPDPAHLASVIGPEDELILYGPKPFSKTFCSPLELRKMKPLSLGNL